MPQRSRFQAPRVVQDFATVQRALREVQESLDAATSSRAQLKVYTSDFSLVAGGFHRVSAQLGRTVNARLPAATGANLSEPATLHLEGMQGTVRVAAAPGQLVNGQPYATFDTDGVVTLWSNGVNAWTGVAQLPAESPGGAALDAEYVLGVGHASLPNGRVATASTEISPDVSSPGVISWLLNAASVGFNKLANLTGLSVLGRAANSSGAMAAITATAARQTLRVNDAGTALEWGHPVEVRDSGADQGDAFALDFVAGTNCNLAASVAAGVATITPSVDLSSVTYTAGDGIDLAANQFSVDVSDFQGTGLEDDGSNNLRIAAAAAGAGLTGGGGSALAVGAGTGITVNANDVAWSGLSVQNNNSALGTFVGIDCTNTTSIIATSASNITEATVRFERAALTGAISAAQNVNATQFAGIRDNGSLETARTHLNFVSTALDTTFSLTQDAGNDEIEVRVSTLGSFYAQNSGATVQTKFISFDDGTGMTASVVNNTGTSGYINVTFSLANIAGLSVLGRSANSSGTPEAVTATAACQALMANSAGTAIGWRAVELDDLPSIGNNRILVNVSGGTAPPGAPTIASLLGAGLVFNGTSQQIEVNPGEGRHIYVDATSSEIGFRKSRRRETWWEDFEYLPFGRSGAGGAGITTSGLTLTCGTTNWYAQATGASGNVANVAPTSGHPGILRLTTGGSNANAMTLYRGVGDTGGTLSEHVRADQIYMAEAIVRIPTSVASVLWEFGFRDNAGNNYIEFYGDTSVGSTIRSYTEEGGTSTDTDTGTAFAVNAWNVYTILKESAGTVDFYVDDVLETTHSTNVPDSETVLCFFRVLTRTNSAKFMDIDYVAYESADLGARTS